MYHTSPSVRSFSLAAVACLATTIVGTALLTFQSVGFWVNAVIQLGIFLMAALFAARITGGVRSGALVGFTLGLTWGTIAVVAALAPESDRLAKRAALVVLGYVLLSWAFAHWIGRRMTSARRK